MLCVAGFTLSSFHLQQKHFLLHRMVTHLITWQRGKKKKGKENSAVEINLNRNVMNTPAKNHLQNLLFNANHQKWDIHKSICESGDKELLFSTQSSLLLANSISTTSNQQQQDIRQHFELQQLQSPKLVNSLPLGPQICPPL